MNTIAKVKVLLIMALLSSPAFAFDALYTNHRIEVVSIDQSNDRQHAKVFCSINKRPNKGFHGWELINRGQGHYGKHKNIKWETSSYFHIDDGLMKVNKSTRRIFDGQGRLIETFSKSYDYQNNMVLFAKIDSNNKVLFEEKYSIQGPICDDTNLVHFIRGIFMNGQEHKYPSFYLITNEPEMYKVNTKFIKNEILDLPGGSYDTVKLQLTADLGILTEIAAKIVSPTYVWLSKDYPHQWLQYEGKDLGARSASLRTYLFNVKETDS